VRRVREFLELLEGRLLLPVLPRVQIWKARGQLIRGDPGPLSRPRKKCSSDRNADGHGPSPRPRTRIRYSVIYLAAKRTSHNSMIQEVGRTAIGRCDRPRPGQDWPPEARTGCMPSRWPHGSVAPVPRLHRLTGDHSRRCRRSSRGTRESGRDPAQQSFLAGASSFSRATHASIALARRPRQHSTEADALTRYRAPHTRRGRPGAPGRLYPAIGAGRYRSPRAAPGGHARLGHRRAVRARLRLARSSLSASRDVLLERAPAQPGSRSGSRWSGVVSP
jgi:hypothetical protein